MTKHQSRVVLVHMRDALAAILGEAAKQIDSELRGRYSHIPWRRIAGLRDVLIHSGQNKLPCPSPFAFFAAFLPEEAP